MFKNRTKVLLVVYTKGGHGAQMKRFLANAPSPLRSLNVIALTDVKATDQAYLKQYYCVEARDKYSTMKSISRFFLYTVMASLQILRILLRYRVIGLVSTGPGIAFVPAIICRLLRIKVIYFESWSRVYTPSTAGKVILDFGKPMTWMVSCSATA